MRFKTMFIIVAAVLILASTVFAGAERTGRQRLDIDTFLTLNQIYHSPSTRSVFEGFEGGVVPASWTVAGTTTGTQVWGVSNSTAVGSVEGSYCAYIGYDLANPQNETLSFEYTLSAGDDQLSFQMAGSRGADWSANASETVEITHAAGTTVVFDFDSATETDQTFERFDVDLSTWDGETVTITFRYEGLAGDLHALDAVAIDDGTGWIGQEPVAPANDLCSGAISINQGAFIFQGNTVTANNDYDTAGTSGCTGFSAAGKDVVYTIGLAAGQLFSVTMTTDGWDDSLYLITDCEDSANSCVAGSDLSPDGSNFEYINNTGHFQIFFLIVDANGSGSGNFTIEGYNEGVVPTEETTWGSVKSMYR